MFSVHHPVHQTRSVQHDNSADETPPQEYEIILRKARQLSYKRAPQFVHRLLVAGLGEIKQVVLANSEGQYPAFIDAGSFATMTGRRWDDKHNYWTIDLNDQRIIVTKLGGIGQITGYRQCIGVEDNAMVYSRKCVAFDIQSKDVEIGRGSRALAQSPDDSGV